jgi:hypothetical protein
LIGPLAVATPANNPKPDKDTIGMAYLHQQPQLCLGLDIAKDTITAFDGTTPAPSPISAARSAPS